MNRSGWKEICRLEEVKGKEKEDGGDRARRTGYGSDKEKRKITIENK